MLYLGSDFIKEIKNKISSYNLLTDIKIVENFKEIEIHAAASISIYDFYMYSLYRKLGRENM